MTQPPGFQDPEEATEAQKILQREHSVERGHEKLDELKPVHNEDYQPAPDQLDPELVWFFPALAYCMVGMDRSLFELFSWAAKRSIKVVTHQADKPVALFEGADISDNRWFYTLQGIERGIVDEFSGYIETYQFNDKQRELQWRLIAHKLRIRDPFAFAKTGVHQGADAVVLLPECLTTRRCVIPVQEPGLRLDQLKLGMALSPEQCRG